MKYEEQFDSSAASGVCKVRNDRLVRTYTNDALNTQCPQLKVHKLSSNLNSKAVETVLNFFIQSNKFVHHYRVPSMYGCVKNGELKILF